jgi:hypothetical protein
MKSAFPMSISPTVKPRINSNKGGTKELKAFASELDNPSLVLPHIVEYRVGGSFSFENVKALKRLKGLHFCQLILREASNKAVVSYWRDANCFNSQQREFEALIGAEVLIGKGWHRELSLKPKTWWKRFTPMSVLLTITTLIGFYGTFRASYREWLAPAHVDIFPVQGRRGIEFVEGAPADIHFSVQNSSDWCKARLRMVAITLAGTNQGPAPAFVFPEFDRRDLPALGIGETRDLVVRSSAEKPGSFWLKFEYSVKAGELLPQRLLTNALPVRVWPRYEFSKPYNIQVFPTSKGCKFDVDLSTGVAFSSLICQATVTNVADLRIPAISPVLSYGSEQNKTPNKEVSTIFWTNRPLTAMASSQLTIYLEADNRKESTQWTNICKQVRYVVSQ